MTLAAESQRAPTNPTPGNDDQRRMASLAAVIVSVFGVGMAFGIGYPLAALMLEAWSTPNWLIGIAGAAPAVGVLTALPALPRIVSKWGAVRAIVIGCCIGAAGFLALGFFQNVYVWIAIRFAMSAGLALPWLAGETWINLVTREETRGRVIAIYGISFFSGYSVGPLLLDAIGFAGMMPYLIGAGAMVLAGLPIIIAAKLAPNISSEGSQHSVFTAVRLAPIAMLGGFIGGFAEMSYLALLGNVGLAGGLDQEMVLRLMSTMTVGAVILQIAIGYLADKVSRTRLTVFLAFAFIGLSLLLPIALSDPSWAFALVFVIGGVVLGFYTVGLAVVGQNVNSNDLAAANAAFMVMYQLGAIVGPVAAGAAMTNSPIWGFVISLCVVMALALVVLLVLQHRAKR